MRFGHFVFYDMFDNLSTCFWYCFLQCFFIDFWRYIGSILEAVGIKKHDFSAHDFPYLFCFIFLTFGPKWGPKSIVREFTFSILFRSCSQLFPKGRFGEARGSIFDGFLMILEGFWDDFGGILGIC